MTGPLTDNTVPGNAIPDNVVPDSAVPVRETVLELDSVSKVYPGLSSVVALAGVTFQVRRGELAAVVGPSGSGKSTLLHMMGTLDRPTSGTVRVAGADTARLTDRELAALRATRIGFVFQRFFLAEYATALENVADGLLYSGIPRKSRNAAAAEALAQVGLAHRAQHRPREMSGGERQRVAIARAVVGNPTIVLADEPTGNLDSAAADATFGLLRSLNDNGTTLVIITHDRGLASRMPRCVEMLDGRVTADTVTKTGE